MRRIIYRRLFEQFKVFLSYTTIGTEPVFWYVFPLGTWRNTIVWPTLLLVIDQATDNTFPLTHITTHFFLSGVAHQPNAIWLVVDKETNFETKHYRVVR